MDSVNTFHKQRIVWAIVDTMVHISYTDLDHKDWLYKLGVDTDRFEYIPRGYILKLEDTNTVNIVSYVGSEFKSIFIDDKYIQILKLFVELVFNYSKIEWYSGLKVGQVGDIWKPIVHIQTTPFKKENMRTLSLKEIIQYDYILTDIINYTIDYDVRKVFEKEREQVLNYMLSVFSPGYTYRECDSSSFLESRIHKFNRLLRHYY